MFDQHPLATQQKVFPEACWLTNILLFSQWK